MSAAPRYHPDEGRDDTRENWRAGRSSAQAKNGLAMKAARKFIIDNPGCRKTAIVEATKCTSFHIQRLVGLGAIYFTQKRQPDGSQPQLFFPKAMPDVSDKP